MNSKEQDVNEVPVSVKIMADGPIVLKGDFTLLYNGINKEIHDSMISICRCGLSDHMPFCDGQHRKSGFIG
jgi:CDGSH-type Zn-finger protein